MKGLWFQRLVLISGSKKLANQFVFPKRLNLVTGNDNSIGKSTLVKNLFWTIGCEPEFDLEWKSNDVKALLYFQVNNIDYLVSRSHDSIYFGLLGSKPKRYSKISGDYAIDFAKIVNFDLMLKSRSDELECPPPAFYFLPFYIDQKKSWDAPWNAFDRLPQFSDFRRTLIKYFCGYIKPKHFELEEEVFEQNVLEKAATEQVKRINGAIEVIEEISEKNNNISIALTELEFEKIQSEIKEELELFAGKQAKIFDAQTLLKSETYDLEQQLSIALVSADELEKDYTFAVESVQEDKLECPLCGTMHDNSLVNRAGLLADKSGLESEADIIKELLVEKQAEQLELHADLELVKNEVSRINKKYILLEREEKGTNEPFEMVLHSIAQKNISHTVTRTKEFHELQSKQASDEKKSLKAKQRKLITKEEKEELNRFFMGNLVENIEVLSALGVNLSDAKAPMDYKKLLGGGAAEGTRGVLAYQLSILKQIKYAGHCALAPFVIDTPNQQEQAERRYQKVIDVIKESVPNHMQIILCGMENEMLESFEKDAHVITLDGNRLLERASYDTLRDEYEKVVLSD